MSTQALDISSVAYGYNHETDWADYRYLYAGWEASVGGSAKGKITFKAPDNMTGIKPTSLTVCIPLSGDSKPYDMRAYLATTDTGPDDVDRSKAGYSAQLQNGNAYPSGWSSNIGNPSVYFRIPISELEAGKTYYIYVYAPAGKTSGYSINGKSSSNNTVTLTYTKQFTVTFNANGGNFSNGTTSNPVMKDEGKNLSLNNVSKPSKESDSSQFTITGITGLAENVTQIANKYQNYQFDSWNTQADGRGTSYSSTGSYSTNADITLYAIYTTKDYTYSNNVISGNEWWGITKGDTKNATYKVEFDGNGGTCTAQDIYTDSITTYNSVEWYANENGSGAEYSKTSAFNSAATIYAHWPIKETKTNPIILPKEDSVIRNGYEFKSWNTSPSGNGNVYLPGSSYTPTANIILYAFYENKGLIRVYTSENEFREALVWVFDGTKWVQSIPYIYNGTQWKIGC